MKCVAVCILAVVCLSVAANAVPKGQQDCPTGTSFYSIGCGFVTREATCRESRPRPEKQQSCGFAACHCIHPTVRDEASGQCVHLDKCPGAKIIHTHGRGGVPKFQRRPQPQIPLPPTQNAPVPVAPAPVYNSGYKNYNSGYDNANTGYTIYNTGYANKGNNGYTNFNSGYRNTNSGYKNYNTGYNNGYNGNAVPLNNQVAY